MRLVFEPDIWTMRGEYYSYIRIYFEDTETGERFTTTESDMACYNQVANQYREKHGIPFTDEIIDLRKTYKLSAAKMSSILGFGTNQYRLYEAGELPNESNGKMIRAAMNPDLFLDLATHSADHLSKKELERIISATEIKQISSKELFQTNRGETNGFAPQSVTRLLNLLALIIEKLGDISVTKMNTVLFYTDFLSYRESGMAISGLSYITTELGPAPLRWARVYSAFDEIDVYPKVIRGREIILLKTGKKPEDGVFSVKELSIVNYVCNNIKDKIPEGLQFQSESYYIPFSESFKIKIDY